MGEQNMGEQNNENENPNEELEKSLKEKIKGDFIRQIKEERTAREELQKQIEELKKKNEQEKLLENEQYKELLEKTSKELEDAKAAKEALEKEYKTFAVKSTVENKLISLGVDNKYTRKGLIDEYLELSQSEEIEPDEWIGKLDQSIISSTKTPGVKNPKFTGTPKSKADLNDETAKELLKSSDAEERQKARQYFEQKIKTLGIRS